MKKIIVLMAILVIVVLALLGYSKEDNIVVPEKEVESFSLIKLSDLRNQPIEIPVNGKIESEKEARLSMEAGGQVKDLLVSVGDSVSTGDVLIILDDADQKLRVEQARAALNAQVARLSEMLSGSLDDLLAIKESVVSSAENALDRAIVQSGNSVADAKKSLLNNDLKAYLAEEIADDNYSTQAPTITGTYTGDEGEYLITLYQSQSQSGYSFRYTHPDGSGSGIVSTRSAQPLGESGLYILFPDNFARLFNVKWVVPIPNTRSATYVTYKNAYENTLREREYSVRQAEEALNQAQRDLELTKIGSREEQLDAQRAQVKQAEVSLSLVESQLSKHQLRAPFGGSVSSLSVKKGETVNIGQSPITIVNPQSLKLTTFVSPERSKLISLGDRVLISDKYNGSVASVSNAINPENGQVEVSIYFTGGDFRSGEYVGAKIFGIVNNDRVSVPLSSVRITKSGSFVYDDKLVAIPVTLGVIENDKVLVVDGLDNVESIVSNISSIENEQ